MLGITEKLGFFTKPVSSGSRDTRGLRIYIPVVESGTPGATQEKQNKTKNEKPLLFRNT